MLAHIIPEHYQTGRDTVRSTVIDPFFFFNYVNTPTIHKGCSLHMRSLK